MKKLSNKKKGEFIRISLASDKPLCRGKVCSDCLKFLKFENYAKRADSLDLVNNTCKKCVNLRMKSYYEENKDKVKKRVNRYRVENREQINAKKRAYGMKWRRNNSEKAKEKRRNYNKKHRGKKNYYTANRRASKKRATPQWLTDFDKQYMKSIYLQSSELEKMDGTLCNVDHIIPLNHEKVCGLHVPWNLQILESSVNFKKGNNFDGTYENESWKKEII